MDILAICEPLVKFSFEKEGGLDRAGRYLSGYGGHASNFAVAAQRVKHGPGRDMEALARRDLDQDHILHDETLCADVSGARPFRAPAPTLAWAARAATSTGFGGTP